jgi:hypothetical protein
MTTERRFAIMEFNSHRPMAATNAQYESANGIKRCLEHVIHNSFTLRRIWASDGGERMIAHTPSGAHGGEKTERMGTGR